MNYIPSGGEDKAATMAAAFAPLASRAGIPTPEGAVMQARMLYVGRQQARPPIQQLVPKLVDVLTGRDLLFRRGDDIVFRDPSTKRFVTMDAETLCSWVASPQGGQIVLVAGYEKGAGPNGESKLIEGDLSYGQSKLALKSIDFKASLPELTKVNAVRLPMLNAKGELRLMQPGYDAEAKTWTEMEITYDTEMDLRDAMTWIDDLTRTFSWRQRNRDFAIWLAGLVTMYARGVFRGRAPAFFVGANLPESGKSILTKLISWAVHGTRSHKNLEEDQEEELRKYLDGVARAGMPYVNFENIDLGGRELRMPLLDTFIESSDWEMRIMGGQRIERHANEAMVMGSANNVTWSRDIQRRSLLCDLYNPMAGSERQLPADARLIDADFWSDDKNRQVMLSACWAMLREWDNRGRPLKPGKLLGSFEGWAKVVPAVVWTTGMMFGQEWDCMMENSNERMGDTRSRDFYALAVAAIEQYRVDADNPHKCKFRVMVKELAAIARLRGLEAVCGYLYPETSIEAVLACKDFRRPDTRASSEPIDDVDALFDEQPAHESSLVTKAAAEYLSSKAASSLGKALNKELHERHFKASDGSVYSFTSVKNSNPRCFEIELAR